MALNQQKLPWLSCQELLQTCPAGCFSSRGLPLWIERLISFLTYPGTGISPARPQRIQLLTPQIYYGPFKSRVSNTQLELIDHLGR